MSLPASASDVRMARWRPSRDLSLSASYARISMPPDDAVDLVGRLGMSGKGEDGALGLLPAAWGTMPGMDADWWDAGPDTPPESFGRPFGVSGWMVAKIERGRLYLIVHDTGKREG